MGIQEDEVTYAESIPKPRKESSAYRRDSWQNGPTSVYQYYDAEHRLLYVGITRGGDARLKQHSRTATWWPSAVTCSIEHFNSRLEAATRERELIEQCSPLFNIAFNRV